LQIVGAPPTVDSALARIEETLAIAGEVPVSAFELSDLDRLAAGAGLSLRTLLERLREAGLELVADAAVDRLPKKEAAIEAVNMAGLILARASLTSGPGHPPIESLRQVADLQRSVGVLRTFRPLPRRIDPERPTTGYADIREVALARLLVDNVEMIQVDWTLYGPKLAQVALAAGADDVDQVPALEPPREGRAGAAEVRGNVEAAGFTPAERNGRFDER
jgi:aminodeoxyfutalosine synthase